MQELQDLIEQAAIRAEQRDHNAAEYDPGNEVGQVAEYPVIEATDKNLSSICAIVDMERAVCSADWDAFEQSMDFKRHPLL